MVHFALPPILKSIFGNLTFPKTKADLLSYAREQKLPEDVLVALETMPDHIFNSNDEFIRSWALRSEFQVDAAPTPSVDMPVVDKEEGSTEDDGDEDGALAATSEDTGSGDMLAPSIGIGP